MLLKNDYPSLKAYKKSYAYRHVFTVIKEEIVSGSLKPGDRLPSENDLCLRLDIGRSAVREGLRELEALGLVQTVSGKRGGRFVKEVNPDFIVEALGLVLQLNHVSFEQFMDARKVIESAAAEMAAFQRTPEDLGEMLRTLTLMRQSVDKREIFFKRNYAFHKAMVAASHNTMLFFIIQALQKLVFNYFDFFTLDKIEIDTAYVYELHHEIYRAIKNRDVAGSRETTIRDLDDFIANYKRYYQEKPKVNK
jgi:GntR family transcriptional regulator, transcriptional repressor for pyruvate dehydrogenase complex